MAKGQDEMGEIVDQCLGLVKTGQATPESILAQVSNIPGGARPQLQMALWLNAAGGALDPRPDYVLASRRRLVERIRQEALSAGYSRHAAQPNPFRMFWRRELPRRKHAFHYTLTLLLFILLFLVGQAILLTSLSAFPGDAIYPVKTAQERVQLAIAPTEIREAELRIQFAQRRLVEIDALILESRFDWIPGTAAAYEQQVNGAVEALPEVFRQDNRRGRGLAVRLHNILTHQIQMVTALHQSAPPDVQPDVSRVLAVLHQNLSAVQGLLDENETIPVLPDSDTPPPAPATR